jgi:two-component system OmpR family response regulator
MRILLIEDEPTLREQLHQALLQAGHTVETAADGETAQYLGEVESFDAAVLDLGLPVRDGLSVLRAWRAQGRSMPVLILTARAAWHEKVAGMDAGADDYLAKPFHMEELLARLRALLRRLSPHASALWQCGSITLDSRQARVTVEGQALTLTSHEFKVLALLMQRMGAVVSRTELSEHIYPQDSDRDSNTIEVFVGRLRKNCPQARSKPCAAWAIAWLRHPTKNKAYVRAHPDLPHGPAAATAERGLLEELAAPATAGGCPDLGAGGTAAHGLGPAHAVCRAPDPAAAQPAGGQARPAQRRRQLSARSGRPGHGLALLRRPLAAAAAVGHVLAGTSSMRPANRRFRPASSVRARSGTKPWTGLSSRPTRSGSPPCPCTLPPATAICRTAMATPW